MNGIKTGAPTLSPNFFATSKSERELPAPEPSVNPDHQQHGAARLEQDWQELEERQQKKLQFREKLCDHDANYCNWAKRFFHPAPSGLGGWRLVFLGFFGLKIHWRKLDRHAVQFIKRVAQMIENIARQ